jgi:hypothetical protein
MLDYEGLQNQMYFSIFLSCRKLSQRTKKRGVGGRLFALIVASCFVFQVITMGSESFVPHADACCGFQKTEMPLHR